MGKYAFIKLIDDGDTVKPDIETLPGIPHGMHWERFGSNKFGWDLVYINYPVYTTATDYYVLDADRMSLTVGEIPSVKRQQLNDWLTNKGYDTSWITGSNTVKQVLKDILHHLNDRFGVADDLIRFAKRIND